MLKKNKSKVTKDINILIELSTKNRKSIAV